MKHRARYWEYWVLSRFILLLVLVVIISVALIAGFLLITNVEWLFRNWGHSS